MAEAAADREVVEALCNRLAEAYEAFAKERADADPKGLRYIDGLMGCHNFYKAVVLDIGRRTGQHAMVQATALDTLRAAFLSADRARLSRS